MRTGIGDTLRAARRAQGRTLRDAAQATRVRETYLAALEEEEFDVLGGEVYARGFLRSYARFLALDPDPLLAAYADRQAAAAARGGRPHGRAAPARRPPSRGGRAEPPRERPAGAAVLLVLLVLVLAAVALVGLWDGRADALAVGLAVVAVRR